MVKYNKAAVSIPLTEKLEPLAVYERFVHEIDSIVHELHIKQQPNQSKETQIEIYWGKSES